MSAQFDTTPGLPLPQPSSGPALPPPAFAAPPAAAQHQQFMTPQPVMVEPTVQQTPQHPPTSFQQQTSFNQPPQQLQQTVQSQAIPQQIQQSQMAPTQPQQPEVTDNEKDGDTLDEEWVAKAKTVMDQYREDPHALSSALTALRADYLRVRHGIMSKVKED